MKIFIIVSFLFSIKLLSVTNRDLKQLDPFNVITVGEMHGSNEMPKLSFDLVKKFAKRYTNKKIILGLEIPRSEQELVNKLIKSGLKSSLKGSSFFNGDYQDGRASKAMIEGLISLKDYDNISVLCFDESQPYSDNRDKEMAKKILSNLKKVKPFKTVILAGNIHPKRSIGSPWDKSFRPMGYELDLILKNSTKVLAIKGSYRKGQIWACQGMKASDCGIVNFKGKAKNPNKQTNKKPGLNLLNKQVEGYNAFFYWDEITASKPWFK